MYKELYYSVKLPEGLTHKISSTVGLKQGCILSPTLFSLYINDLVDMFDSTCDPVEQHNRKLLGFSMQMILSLKFRVPLRF